ncbi:acyl-CoA dehydrogenase [Tomitella biformata]|uniref:acyl-CoA dehydrogenase n=1 Tax=Tomitella biformata TaxID=630403 RepID=UPI000462F4EC|nr:acyl-CoA dehydrogenase [Tomitella biformata]
MALALEEEHRHLAESVESFGARADGIAHGRAHSARLAAGELPDTWDQLVQQRLHAIHLPEQHGGDGAGIAELAVVVEQLGKALYPGPFLPTVIASAILARAGASAVAAGLLAEFAGGATGAASFRSGLTAERTATGWRVDGVSEPVLGLPGADIVLARALDGAGSPVWFRLAGGASATITAQDGVDLTRSIGVLELRGHEVPEADVLAGVTDADAEWLRNTLFAAEATGIAAWTLSTAVEYIKTREQFGRAVGSFQAVQHKAAMMLVRAEIGCAAAWDAARAQEHDADQRALVTAQAAVAALSAGVDNSLECVTLLGGVGFTWEHDVHLYWRRAISLAALAGSEELWAQRLGELAITTTRDFSFVADDTLPALRAEVAAVLEQLEALPDDAVRSEGWAPERGGSRRALLAGAGLVAPHYPKPYGLGAGPEQQAVIAQEFAARGLTQPTTVIGEWVLPTILEHGSPQQQGRFIDPTLRGEIVWCQLFSEPGAGSDLAGLSTAARKVDGGWLLSGQKVWNSMAHEADWGVCLARTDPDAPKHKGISYFLVDMKTPGVDVRPLRQATGFSEFNEVFLDEVFVPDECLVSEPNQGWRLAVTTLSNERLSMGGALGHGSSDRYRDVLAQGAHSCSRADAVRALGHSTSREFALSALNLRGVLARLASVEPGAEISVAKVYNALAQREGSRDLLRLLGPQAAVLHPEADHVIDHIGLPAILFGGGTVEIQLNVISRRVLGLPR